MNTTTATITLASDDFREGETLPEELIYNAIDLSSDLTGLEAGAGKAHHNPHGSTHGLNDFGQNAYAGPCPPPGDRAHRYAFTLYALDVPKLEGADHSLTYARFRFMIREHILAEGTLTGRYGVPAK
jgi:Raf kinase inhibitor-like YbhB/YbcL family protein